MHNNESKNEIKGRCLRRYCFKYVTAKSVKQRERKPDVFVCDPLLKTSAGVVRLVFFWLFNAQSRTPDLRHLRSQLTIFSKKLTCTNNIISAASSVSSHYQVSLQKESQIYQFSTRFVRTENLL